MTMTVMRRGDDVGLTKMAMSFAEDDDDDAWSRSCFAGRSGFE